MKAAPEMLFDVIVIGAGVVGLAIAGKLAGRNRKLAVLERHDSFGRETSSRNSEVIHAGIYYPHNFLKSRLCVAGNRLLYSWCGNHDIPHAQIGKLVVATNDEEEFMLSDIRAKAEQNGVLGLEIFGKKQVRAMEGSVKATAALFSPSTGIIDSHRLMRSFLFDAEDKGAIMAYRSEVTAIHFDSAFYDLEINEGEYHLRTRTLINSAGLYADRIAAMTGIDIDEKGYRLKPCKGNYFRATPSPSLRHLVYPVPVKNNVGLGIHATLDLNGQIRFGPDSRYLNKEEIHFLAGGKNMADQSKDEEISLYKVDEDRKEAFAGAICKYLPGIDAASLFPDMSGIRPKIQGPGDAVMDFIIKDEEAIGFPSFINLIGIESPGLTACLAIAEYVKDKYLKDGQ